jgi:hypothetical protein
MMRLVDERKRARPSNASSLKALSEVQENRERPGSAHGVQTGIQAFFNMSKPIPQKKEAEIIVLSDSEEDSSEVEIVSPPKRDSEGDSSEVEIVESPPKRDSLGKRKECESGSEAGSAEKKSKTA